MNGEVLLSDPQTAAASDLASGVRADDGSFKVDEGRLVDHSFETKAAPPKMLLELQDGSSHSGFNFGARRSVAGELVFQTGMVGYPESITDPSYRGQILVMTWPLVGNYGVPSREAKDPLLAAIPAHFEAAKIHISGLVVASYAGEDYSHHLASSSLGAWLRENNVPAIYGVDTRALTKKIRMKGSMLGRMLLERSEAAGASNHEGTTVSGRVDSTNLRSHFEHVDWTNPNELNLVKEGKTAMYLAFVEYPS